MGSDMTLEKLREAAQIVDSLPPVPAFDLWPHDLPSSAMYKLNGGIVEGFGHATKGRTQLVVPRLKIDQIAYDLRCSGADVRIEPHVVVHKIEPRISQEERKVIANTGGRNK